MQINLKCLAFGPLVAGCLHEVYFFIITDAHLWALVDLLWQIDGHRTLLATAFTIIGLVWAVIQREIFCETSDVWQRWPANKSWSDDPRLDTLRRVYGKWGPASFSTWWQWGEFRTVQERQAWWTLTATAVWQGLW